MHRLPPSDNHPAKRRRDPRWRGKSRARRGAVIVLMLITVVVASLLLSQFIERTTTELLVESRAAQADRLRVDAFSALEVSLAVLADFQAADGGLWAPAQGWGDPFAWAGCAPREGVTVAVAFEDESGKPSLPRMDFTELQDLGALLDLDARDARRFADALLLWTQPDYTPADFETDPGDYERADPPHDPPGRPLRSFAELASIDGVRNLFYDEEGRPTERWQRFSRAVSLYSFATPNLNSAGAAALLLAGFDDGQSHRLGDYLGGRVARPPGAPPYFRSAAEAEALVGAGAPLAGFGAEVHCLRIGVTVHEGATVFRLTAVVAPPGAVVAPGPDAQPDAPETGGRRTGYPFVILELREELEPAAAPGGEA